MTVLWRERLLDGLRQRAGDALGVALVGIDSGLCVLLALEHQHLCVHLLRLRQDGREVRAPASGGISELTD